MLTTHAQKVKSSLARNCLGMAESFEGTRTPESVEDKLTADIADGDDDNALLDTVLGDVSTNDDQDRELNILDQDEGSGEQAEDPVGSSYTCGTTIALQESVLSGN